MQCSKPIWLTKNLDRKKFPLGLYVPCGKCVPCLQQRAREWGTRLTHEMKYHEKAMFVTLTYSEKNIPENYSLKKRHLQLFIKRLRKRLGKQKIKYYGCGEYGDRFKRPHYHLIIFGIGEETVVRNNTKNVIGGEVYDCWQLGYVHIGSVTEGSCQYTTKYMEKQISERVYKASGREPVFKVQSNGMGLQYALDNSEKLKYYKSDTKGGKKIGIPRYYRNKLGIAPDEMRLRAEETKTKKLKKLKEKNPGLSRARLMSMLEFEQKQKAINATERYYKKEASKKPRLF